MNPKIQEIVDYIQSAHPDISRSLDEVIRDCAAHGFSPVQIIAGIRLVRDVAPSDAKKLVVAHPVWGEAREEWAQFHEDLERAMDEESKS